jgi:CheY-like chemotaxis protein
MKRVEIVIVEDHYWDSLETAAVLRKAIPEVRIDRIDTESEFRTWLASLMGQPPDLVILDVRLPWTRPAPIVEAVPEGYTSDDAGLRCYHLLRGHPDCGKVPVILLTHASVVVPDGAACLPKSERARLGAIVRRTLSLEEGT